MKSVIILLVVVGVAVADVSELVNAYLPPLVEKIIPQEVPTTEAPIAEPETTTALPTTTVVEIEQVPLEEMHYEEQPREVTQMTEEPAVPSIYQQPPNVETQTEPAVEETSAPALDAVTTEPAPIVVEEEIVIIAEQPAEVTDAAPAVESTPASEASVLIEAGSAIDDALEAMVNEAPAVKEAPEVPAVEVEPEPAHELAEDGYRYKSANRFRYRF